MDKENCFSIFDVPKRYREFGGLDIAYMGYGYLNGRDGAVAGPAGYFDDYLAAEIRSAQMSIDDFPDEYEGKIIKIYSIDNTCNDILRTSGPLPQNTVFHWASDGKIWSVPKTQMQDLLSVYEEEKFKWFMFLL